MRHGHTAGLLGVVIKVCLCIHVCVVTDDLDGVLVGSNSTVSPQSPELAVDGSFRCGNQRSANLQRQVCHIIHDTDGEFCFLGVVVYGNDLSRCGVLGTQSVTSGEYRNLIELASLQGSYHIQIQGLTLSARLFCSVQNGDLFYRIRDRVDQGLCAERSVQTNGNQTNFSSGSHQVVDGLLDGLAGGTHGDDDMLSILSSVVVEQFVVGSDLLINFVHVLLHYCRQSVVVGVAGLSCLEEDIRVLSGSSLAGMVGIQSVFTELIDGVQIHQIFQILVIPGLDLLDLVRSTESVEEVDERNFSFDGSAVSHGSQIHNFLYGRLTQHSAACLTTCIYIGMISENR